MGVFLPDFCLFVRMLAVIPGRVEDASPESITTIVSMDSGLDALRCPGMTGRLYCAGGLGQGRCGPRRPSNALAIASTPISSKRRPTICTPIGKPCASKPPLIEIAGFSAMFHRSEERRVG